MLDGVKDEVLGSDAIAACFAEKMLAFGGVDGLTEDAMSCAGLQLHGRWNSRQIGSCRNHAYSPESRSPTGLIQIESFRSHSLSPKWIVMG